MYDQGVNETTIQRLAGHSNLSTTRHYNRKLREYDKETKKPRKRLILKDFPRANKKAGDGNRMTFKVPNY